MRRVALVMFLIGLIAVAASAQTALHVPENATSQQPFISTGLPQSTVVQGRFFSLMVPKDWTVSSIGPTAQFLDDITVTVGRDPRLDHTYLGLHTFKQSARYTIEEKFAREKGKLAASDKLSQETWQGRKWIVKEYACQSRVPQSAALCWTAWIYVENKRVGILTASTPASLAARYADPLRTMMQSVKFHPPSR
ncbi:MAG: hypothetical protein EXR97_03520 [Nitrospiraceae bacterium]|nr:hypothetical protein [Nitrospiraceae bacterium]